MLARPRLIWGFGRCLEVRYRVGMPHHTQSDVVSPETDTPSLFSSIESVLFYGSFILASAGLLWIVWGYEFPVMVDFPPFAGGIDMLRIMVTSETSELHKIFELDLLQPYVLPFLLGAALSSLVDSVSAAKVLVSIAGIGGPLACLVLTRQVKADRWWALLVFATFFGYAYVWGMVSQLFAVPVAFLFIAACARAAESASWKNVVMMLVIGTLLPLCHGLLALFAFGIGGLLLLGHWPRRAPEWASVGALAALCCLDAVMLNRSVKMLHYGFMPAPEWFSWTYRVSGYLSSILGPEGDLPSITAWTVFMLVVVHVTRASYQSPWNRRLLIAMVPIAAFSLPVMISAKSLLPRFASLTAAIAVLTVPYPQSRVRRLVLRTAIVLLIPWQLSVNNDLASRMDTFMQPFRQLTSRIAPGQSLVTVCYQCALPDTWRPVLLHVAGWNQALKHGYSVNYFPNISPWIVRFREDFQNQALRHWQIWEDQSSEFDFHRFSTIRYFLIKGTDLSVEPVVARGGHMIQLVERIGDWRLYENRNPDANPYNF